MNIVSRPLFVEMNLYIRAAMPDAITEFMQVDIACYVYLGGNMANSGYDLITPATQLERYIQLRSTLWMLVLYTLEF